MTKSKAKLSIAKPNGGGLHFKIERNIPLASRKKPNPFAYLFEQMKAGDSFLIGHDEKKISLVYYHASKWGKENDATFAFRILEEGKRCWRVK